MNRLASLSIFALIAAAPLVAAESIDFQAQHGSSTFGYDYREGCAIEGDAIACAAHAGNSDYLGESITSGANFYGVAFGLKADSEGEASVARAAFTFDHGGVAAGNKGNGRDSGAFANSVQAELVEGGSGDNWKATLWQVHGGVRTELASLTNSGVDDGSFQSFRLNVDLYDGAVSLFGPSGLLLEAVVTAPFSVFSGQWFVLLSTDDGCFGGGFECEATTRISLAGTSTAVYNMEPAPPEWVGVAPTMAGSVPENQAAGMEGTLSNGDGAVVEGFYTIDGGAPLVASVTQQTSGEYVATVPGQSLGTKVAVWMVATDDREQSDRSASVEWIVGGEAPRVVAPPAPSGVDDESPLATEYLLLAGLSAITGLGVFVLLRKQSGRFALVALIMGLGSAAFLVVKNSMDVHAAWFGIVPALAFLVLVKRGRL